MKAVVLETREREAAILRMDGVVCRVRGRYRVGQEIEYIEAARPSFAQWIAAVLVAAILLGGSAGLWIGNNYVACAEVSLDVNPSIVYTLNRRNRVLTVEAVNDDAADIVQALRSEDVRFMPIGDAVERTMDVLTARGYLNADDDCVLAGVSADDEGRRNDLAESVEAAFTRTMAQDPTMAYRIERTDRAAAKEARAHGMSPGRYAAWREQDDGPEPDEYADMPVKQIIGRAEAPAEDGSRTGRSEPPAEAGESSGQPEPPAEAGESSGQPEPPAEGPGESMSAPSDDGGAAQPEAKSEAPREPQTEAEGQPPEAATMEKAGEGADAPDRREGGQDEGKPGEAKPGVESGGRGDKKPSSDAGGGRGGAGKPSPGGRQRGGEAGKGRR